MPITYTLNIPDAPNDPSADQGPMQTNTNSINTLIAVDHYSFADTPSGTHKQVTLSGKNAAGAQTDPTSTLYTASGTASTVADLIYRNQNGVFPISCLRAWGYVSGGVGPAIIASQGVNVASITRTSAGRYVVTLTALAVNSSDFAVTVTSSLTTSLVGTQSGYTITAPGVFQLNFTTLSGNALVDPTSFTFQVYQI